MHTLLLCFDAVFSLQNIDLGCRWAARGIVAGLGGRCECESYPDYMVHGANMGPIVDWQDPGGPHVGPMNFDIKVGSLFTQ